MTDNSETIVLRLREFIQAVVRKVDAAGFQTIIEQPRMRTRDERILQTYATCLNKLTDAERGDLYRMIQKMSGALGSPPGAITPP